MDLAKSIMRLAEPPLLSKFPARINIGIAMRANLLIPSKMSWGIVATSRSVKSSIVITVLAPSETATGTPISMRPNSEINKNAMVIGSP